MNPPFFTGLVLVAPKLFAANRAIDDLFFAENVQAKILARTGTKTYVGTINGFKGQYYVSCKYTIKLH